jgi:simple sugar transport system permease protein
MTASEPGVIGGRRPETRWDRFRKHSAANIVIIYSLLILVCVVVDLTHTDVFPFLSELNLSVVLQQIPRLMLLAIGVGLLMISGEFDLSVGGVFVLSGFVFGSLIHDHEFPVLVAFFLTLGVGCLVGAVNGQITNRFNIPSFITTLGMMFVTRGLVRWIAGSGSRSNINQQTVYPGELFEKILTGQIIGPIYAQLIWAILIAIGAYYLLNRHRFGNQLFAVGGNRDAAISVGINVDRVKLIAFMICSTMAALTGVVSATRINAVIPTQYLVAYELRAIAACVVGGLFLFGGRGTILGIVLGAAMLATMEDVLALMRSPGEYFKAFIGIVLIAAVVLNTFVAKRVTR